MWNGVAANGHAATTTIAPRTRSVTSRLELVSSVRSQLGFVTNRPLTFITDSSRIVTMLLCKERLLILCAKVVTIYQVKIQLNFLLFIKYRGSPRYSQGFHSIKIPNTVRSRSEPFQKHYLKDFPRSTRFFMSS